MTRLCLQVKAWGWAVCLACSLLPLTWVHAQTQPVPAASRSASQWLLRMHEAPRHHNYTGTLVVSSGTLMASSRVWHVCDGDDVLERVQSLNGAPRITLRHNQNVITFLPKTKRAFTELRDSLGLLNSRVSVTDTTVDQYYRARYLGLDRLAGLETELVLLEPTDKYRFAYKIWADKKTGLIVKMETLNEQGYSMEQVGYTELRLSADLTAQQLASQMGRTQGYSVHALPVQKINPQAQGWTLSKEVPGFKSMSAYLRPAEAGTHNPTLQWIFSDGLASVSVFIDRYDPQLHKQEGLMISGATHTWVKHLKTPQAKWVTTVVGEVPVATLQMFPQVLAQVLP